MTTKIILNLAMIPGKIEGKSSFLRHEDQSPIQTGPAFVNLATKLADGNSRVRVRVPKSVLNESQGGRHLGFAARFPDNLLESSGELNGNHAAPR